MSDKEWQQIRRFFKAKGLRVAARFIGRPRMIFYMDPARVRVFSGKEGR